MVGLNSQFFGLGSGTSSRWVFERHVVVCLKLGLSASFVASRDRVGLADDAFGVRRFDSPMAIESLGS